MPSQDEIDNQLKRLAQYRRNLSHLLKRADAAGGEDSADLPTINQIRDQRTTIDAIKTRLRAAGVAVADEFDDGAGALAPTPAPAPASTAATQPAVSAATLRPTVPQQVELVRHLLACQSIGDRPTRDLVLGFLPDNVRANIMRHGADQTDVLNIVQTCARYDGAIEQLAQAVQALEGESIAVRKLNAYLAQIR